MKSKYILYDIDSKVLYESDKANSIEECFLEAVNKGVNLENLSLENAHFKGITLKDAKLFRAFFRNCSFEDCKLIYCDFPQSFFYDSHIQYSRINDCSFRDGSLDGLSLNRNEINNCNFIGSDLNNLNDNEFNDNHFTFSGIKNAKYNDFFGNDFNVMICGDFNNNNIRPSKQLLAKNKIEDAEYAYMYFKNVDTAHNNSFKDITFTTFAGEKSSFKGTEFINCDINNFYITEGLLYKNVFHRCNISSENRKIKNCEFTRNDFRLCKLNNLMENLSTNGNKASDNKIIDKEEVSKELAEPSSPGM